ncbi:glycosyltransferase [Vibrio vulnificus]|nr:glycosyltransferase [Vibrio vulnificus]
MPTNTLAPIVVFVYNRPWHTQQTIEALQKNELSDQSDLILYSDGPKNDQSRSQVQEVRNYLKTVSGFKSIKIIERDKNWGLAANIIDGVSEVINHYGKVIVMEDDIVTSPSYLSFMNQALDYYQNENKVWHVSGWNYPIEYQENFLWRTMNCWGWATWRDRWAEFDRNPSKIINSWNNSSIYRFNLDGAHDFWSQIKDNHNGKLNTWAIFWYATIFINNGLCLNPGKTLVHNIGNDGSGENCKDEDLYAQELDDVICSLDFPSKIEESELAVMAIKRFMKVYRGGFFRRILRKIKGAII